MRKSSVVTPLTLGFSIMVVLTGLLLLLSLTLYARQLYFSFWDIIEGLNELLITERFESNLLEARWAAGRYVASGDPVYRTQAVKARERASKDYEEDLLDLVEESEQNAFSAKYEVYLALLDGMLYYSGEADDPQAYESEIDVALSDLLESNLTVYEHTRDQVQTDWDHYRVFFESGYKIVAISGGVLIFLGAATGLTLGRHYITAPLERLTEAARRLGSGDLTAVPETPTSDEIGALAASFRQMTGSLAQAIERMRETSGALIPAADRLSASATNLSELARGTLAQMEEIAQGAEAQREQMHAASQVATGLTAALRQSAQQAGEAGQAAREAQTKLEGTARTVAVLDEEAEEIQSITAVIEQFAQETHMLSLNAAIEARRAGEAGRGFAAVADEMRALAERSARSAGEVARFGARAQAEMESVGQAVADVQGAVTQTADFAGQTVEAARRQEQETARLASIVDQASAVSNAHAHIAEQVSAAVAEQVDAIAELATAAQGLAGMAGQLEDLSARFVTQRA
jgi:methyl-accepting chemotaxis protein